MLDRVIEATVLNEVGETPFLVWVAELACATRDDQTWSSPFIVLIARPKVVEDADRACNELVAIISGGEYFTSGNGEVEERSGRRSITLPHAWRRWFGEQGVALRAPVHISIEGRDVVDARRLEVRVLSFVGPEDAFLDPRLTIDSEAGFGGPSTEQLNDRIWASCGMQRARKTDADGVPGEGGGHHWAVEGSKQLAQRSMHH